MKALVLTSSPRVDGNSARLADQVLSGLREAGHEAKMRDLNAIIDCFLRDCRTCRGADGCCGIQDGYQEFFFQDVLSADGLILATPIYWYGMSAQLKTFFDRMFCYVAGSYPGSDRVVDDLMHKRVGLVLSSEETFPTVSHGIVHQVQEYCRYTNSTLAGVVHGHGNARGDVERDPRNPMAAAQAFGQNFFASHATDYKIDTPRPGKMWQTAVCG